MSTAQDKKRPTNLQCVRSQFEDILAFHLYNLLKDRLSREKKGIMRNPNTLRVILQ